MEAVPDTIALNASSVSTLPTPAYASAAPIMPIFITTSIGTIHGTIILGIGVHTILGGDGTTDTHPIGTPDGTDGMAGTTLGIILGMTPTGTPVAADLLTTPATIRATPATEATEGPPVDT